MKIVDILRKFSSIAVVQKLFWSFFVDSSRGCALAGEFEGHVVPVTAIESDGFQTDQFQRNSRRR
ncbi:MAG: hypothetical protein HYU75_17565 [Betaproteobacteria bacterium]|nr:hypothetical protein [Betaproteobacteria bacterium]